MNAYIANMNNKILIAAEIGILLIALTLIASPVAAINTNLAYNMNPVMKNAYQNFLPADKITVSKNQLIHYTPATNINTIIQIDDSSANPFAAQQTWGCCGSNYKISGTYVTNGFMLTIVQPIKP
jgi:hypothetical protein